MLSGSTPMHMMWSRTFDPDKPPHPGRVDWRRILRYFAPYWRQEALVLTCIVVTAALGQLPPLFAKWIIDRAIRFHDQHALLLDVGGMMGSALIGAAIGAWQGYLNAYVGEGIMRDMRDALVQHLHRMPLSFFTATRTGEIMNRVSSDVDAIDNVVTGTLITIVTNIAIIFTTLIAIFILDWRLAALSLLVIPFMILPLAPVGRTMYKVRKSTREQRDRIESLIQETLSLSGITLIKSFVRERQEAKRFHVAGTELMDLEVRLALVGRWFIAIVGALVIVGPAIVWFGGGVLAIRSGLEVGTIVAFVAYLGRLYGPASALVGVQVQLVSALAVFERIFAYLDMAPEEPVLASAIDLGTARGDILFERVRFSYVPGRVALDAVSFQAKPGQLVAFVGPSGAGKTTIMALLPRFYDPQEGRILVDGHDVRDLRLESLRRNIGIVTQETYLFHASIAENLRYGRPDASDAELVQAARNANIYDLIASLPDGFETTVGERGHKLSGGERQRIAIARVLLKDPRILILDEATSSLDSTSETLIRDALVPLMLGRTSLVVAHRLSTVLRADIIFVIDAGRIVESGRHADLLMHGGLYASLYRAQFQATDVVA
ncbi:MAG: ABC transporter ATP-binding protein [Candidatus Eremiobacteraeota bacterium]|nr:ABC transporter ATP-binding protein [Candidatus Eremiobacteraeota bacterium]MBC5826442.1 ABC transporter ATP-binding protein [Candidatus Eremiobacteraeota bacterium]